MERGNVADVVKECVVVEKGNVDDVNDDESAEGIEIVIVGERRVEAVDL